MRNSKLFIFLMALGMLVFSGCDKNDKETRFDLLTGPVWASDQLLIGGDDASGPGGLLEGFKGDAKFNKDGTGTFGTHTGTWRFSQNETQLVITSEELPLPLTTIIDDL